MNDVAREAGVALKTVSRYVNGQTNIDSALMERIAAAIAKLGYRRNLAAASIRPGWTSKVLGLIIGDLANPYYSTLSRAIETRARENGYLLISASSDEDGARHDNIVDRLMEQRVDGLIVVPPRDAGRPWESVAPPIPPIVVLDRPVDFTAVDTLIADNAGGAKAATAALLAVGARRIAFVGDSLALYTMRERHAGYVAALREADVEPDRFVVTTGSHTGADATRTVSDLMDSTSVDAIFAANNRAAVGAIHAFKSAGRRLPLIGFDDFEAATLTSPATSVVTQNITEMGRKAADIVIARLAGDQSPYQTHTLPTTLVLRGSEQVSGPTLPDAPSPIRQASRPSRW